MRQFLLRGDTIRCRSSVPASNPGPASFLPHSRKLTDASSLLCTRNSCTACPTPYPKTACFAGGTRSLGAGAEAAHGELSAAADQAAPPPEPELAASRSAQHTPVLLDEVQGFFADVRLRTFVDGTLGAGGHACAIAAAHQELRTLVCIDQDQAAFAVAEPRLAAVRRDGLDIRLHQGNFRDMRTALEPAVGGSSGLADGILLDLGVSSMQLDQAGRGFSFMRDGPLDMRMGGGPGASPMSAEALVNTADEAELGRIIRDWGEERGWRRIAARIVQSRDAKPIRTTQQLVAAIGGGRGKGGIHPATRTFQALRIAVNDELGALRDGLPAAIDALAQGGRLAVISFHSLEDRLVKRAFLAAAGRPQQEDAQPEDRQLSMLADMHPRAGPPAAARILTKRPVMAGDAEQRSNPRSRSAKLRVLEKLPVSDH